MFALLCISVVLDQKQNLAPLYFQFRMLLFGYEISRNTIQIQKQNREKRKRKLWRYQKYVFFLPPQKYNYCRDWKNFKCIFSL